MDFLVEVLIGLANANYDSKNEYIIDVKKYPKPLVYLATILYSLFLLAIIGGFFAVGIMGVFVDRNYFWEGIAFLIAGSVFLSIAVRRVRRTVSYFRENKKQADIKDDPMRFYREEWELRKQNEKAIKRKKILFGLFTGVLLISAFIGSIYLRKIIISISDRLDIPKVVAFDKTLEKAEKPVELIESANSDYIITYLSDIKYYNEPATVNPLLISYIGEDSRILYFRVKPGREDVVPFITVTAYDKDGNKIAENKGNYDRGRADFAKDGVRVDREKNEGGASPEGMLTITLDIASDITDVSYSVKCNGGITLTPEVTNREIAEVKKSDGKIHVFLTGKDLYHEVYAILYKDGALVDVLTGKASERKAEVIFEVEGIDFDSYEVYA